MVVTYSFLSGSGNADSIAPPQSSLPSTRGASLAEQSTPITLTPPQGQSFAGLPGWEIFDHQGNSAITGTGTAPNSLTLEQLNPGNYRLQIDGVYASGDAWKLTQYFEITPSFTIRQRNSANDIVADETYITSSGFLDVDIFSETEVQISGTINGIALVENTNLYNLSGFGNSPRNWRVRTTVASDTVRTELTLTFTSPETVTRSIRYFVVTNADTPQGQQVTGITPGAVVTETNNLKEIESAETLTANNNDVKLTLGAEPEGRTSTLLSIRIEIINLDTGQVRTGNSPGLSGVGITSVSAENLPAGRYVARSVWVYSDSNENYTENFYFTVLGLTPSPFPSSLYIYTPEAYMDGEVLVGIWTDATHKKTSVQLEIERIN